MNLNHLKILVAAILYGYIIVGGRLLSNAGLSLIEISLLPLVFVTAIIIVMRPSTVKAVFLPRHLFFFSVFGLIGALLQVTQYAGIVLGVPVAIVAMLLYLQPVWTVILSRLALKEPVTPRKLLSLVLAMAGAVILLDPFSGSGSRSIAGLITAFIAGWILAAWVLWAKRIGAMKGVSAVVCLTGYSLFTSLFLILILVVEVVFIGTGWLGELQPQSWAGNAIAICSVSILAYLVPGILFFWGIGGVAASVAGILLMLEPVSATFLAAIWFREPVTSNIWIGGLLILIANGLIVTRSQK
jgi:drug/metabolite transporter (DMT)-like permease